MCSLNFCGFSLFNRYQSSVVNESKNDAKSPNTSGEIYNNTSIVSSSEDKKVCIKDFTFIKLLGKGTFGKIILAEKNGTEKVFAIKILKKDHLIQGVDIDYIMREKRILTRFSKHIFLATFYASFQTPNSLFFVMEFVSGGNLLFHLQKTGKFNEVRAAFYAAEIVIALQFLHSHGVIHRDLKLDNVLLDQEGHCKLTDFGLSKDEIINGVLTSTYCGTPYYLAPEMLQELEYDSSVDWWALGVLMYIMMTNELPFGADSENDLFELILQYDVFYPYCLSRNAVFILEGLMTKDPADRLGYSSSVPPIRGHAFFKHMDWEELELRRIEPPIRPIVKSPKDTRNFDRNFTKYKVVMTTDEGVQSDCINQDKFDGFSYVDQNYVCSLQQ
ncbi:protein kinase C-like [Contarinia nasturtii]|uniref:protein kinase C-like n=1 Tax=Contarinia nasturtii TaxID=265458 RepID=UPI0012D3B0B0|nr:protein kinase C-like [Contarinia nasturtii]